MRVNSSLNVLTFLSRIPWELNVLNRSSITWVLVIQTVAHNALYGIRPYRVVGNKTSYRLAHDTVMKSVSMGIAIPHFCCCCCCLERNCSRRAPGYFTRIGDKASSAACDSSELTCALKRRCFLHTGNGGHTVGAWVVAFPCWQNVPSRMKPWMMAGPRHRGLTTMWTLTRKHGVYRTPG